MITMLDHGIVSQWAHGDDTAYHAYHMRLVVIFAKLCFTVHTQQFAEKRRKTASRPPSSAYIYYGILSATSDGTPGDRLKSHSSASSSLPFGMHGQKHGPILKEAARVRKEAFFRRRVPALRLLTPEEAVAERNRLGHCAEVGPRGV